MSIIIERETKEAFFDYFERRARFVEENCLERIEGLILMSTYLDSLAGHRFGKDSSKWQFRDFILQYSNYSEVWTRISLPMLKEHLDSKGNDAFYEISEFLRKKFGIIPENYIDLNYNSDCTWEYLLEKAKQCQLENELLKAEKEIKHFECTILFWEDYRNLAVHETAAPRNEPPNIAEHQYPYYVNINRFEGGKIISIGTKFGMPRGFIYTTMTNCINNYRKDCFDNNAPIFDSQQK